MANPGVAHPAPVDRMLRADKLQKGRLALGIGLQSTPQCRDDLRRLRHILSMITLRPGHGRHADLGMIRDFMGVRIVAWSPEARAIPRKAAVVDVDRSHAEAIPGHRLEI